MLAIIRKWVIVLSLIGISGFLLYQWVNFQQAQDSFPVGTSIAGLDVSGMTREEAADYLAERYYAPVYLYHLEEHVELDPQNVGFRLDVESMLAQVERELASRDRRLQFIGFILGRPIEPVSVSLSATHDRASLEAVLQSIADFLDHPAQPAQVLTQGRAIKEGQAGYVTDVTASLPAAEDALYRPENRVAKLTIVEESAPEVNMELLEESINSKLQSFDGLGSVFIMDLQTGEELSINADVALSGLSILKIAIFVEAYRAIDGEPNTYQQQLFLDTATRSSNYGANLLLHVVAGEDNTYTGADILTESMQHLGLVNTFMAVPYDASPPAYRRTTYVTPANSHGELETQPDETMQTTAEEIGTLLAMIYHCSKGGGALLAAYPDQLTPDECQAIIDLMILNEEGNLIRYGVPEGTPVSHKHGWAQATHGDAGIVYSPGGDFVIVEYLSQPGDWLLADQSFPILREIARATYNYFNMEEPYLGNPLGDREQIDPNNPFSEIYEEDVQDPGAEEASSEIQETEASSDESLNESPSEGAESNENTGVNQEG
jgi:beta-lactamase class A